MGKSPSSDALPMGCRVRMTFVSGNLIITTLECLDRDWGSHKRIFPVAGCLLVRDFLQWEKETMKEHELFEISMQGYRKANWPGRRRVSTPREMFGRTGDVLKVCIGALEMCQGTSRMRSVKPKLVLINFSWEGWLALGPRLVLSWKEGENRRRSARDEGLNLLVVRGE
ncbi:hypothetical protein CRG98_006025 [Punica granatum]|uniref:Uncharacterized protein n=1 Tax=Punica granatum TaxID=22663 RepID=A0A2I0KYM6_PUNGR|nr:hypothetical protein CRG98_006025 [Punica granatum]